MSPETNMPKTSPPSGSPEARGRFAIEASDLPPAPTPVYDSVWRCYRGEPWVADGAGNYSYIVPDVPHVHAAKVGLLNPEGHPDWLPDSTNVLTAHGYRDAQGEWVLKDGRLVTEFINNYNLQNPSTPIDVAAVCNPTGAQHDGTTHIKGGDANVSGYKDGDQTVLTVGTKDTQNSYVYRSRSH